MLNAKNIRVCSKIENNTPYLNNFNPFVAGLDEYFIPDSYQIISIPEENYFIKIDLIIRAVMDDFYVLYYKRKYDKKLGNPVNLFNYILKKFDESKKDISHDNISEFVDAAEFRLYMHRNHDFFQKLSEFSSDPKYIEEVKLLKKGIDNYSNISSYIRYEGERILNYLDKSKIKQFAKLFTRTMYRAYKSYTIGRYKIENKWVLIDDEIIYSLFVFKLIDMLLENVFNDVKNGSEDILMAILVLNTHIKNPGKYREIDLKDLEKQAITKFAKKGVKKRDEKYRPFREHFYQKQKEAFLKNNRLTANSFATDFYKNPSMDIPYVPQNALHKLIKLAEENNRKFKKTLTGKRG